MGAFLGAWGLGLGLAGLGLGEGIGWGAESIMKWLTPGQASESKRSGNARTRRVDRGEQDVSEGFDPCAWGRQLLVAIPGPCDGQLD